MKITFGQIIPIRPKSNQYNSYYGKVIAFDPISNVLFVVDRDNKIPGEMKVKYCQDNNGYWWEQT